MQPTTAVGGILLTLAILAVNAFFVAAEFAIVRVRATALQELAEAGSARGRLAQRIVARIDHYLSACQVGITAASLALGAVAEPIVARLIEPLFSWGLSPEDPLFHALSFVIAFALVTYLHIVVGEQAPKYFAIQRALGASLWSAYPLHWFTRVAAPFIWLVNVSANAILAPLGIRPGGASEVLSDEELKIVVAASARGGVLQESERQLLHNVLDFADTLVRQVMIPRTAIVAIEATATIADLVRMAQEHPYTRFPVYREDLDHIQGVVHLRDLIGVDGSSQTPVTRFMRPVFAVPETMPLDRALSEMRRQRLPLFLVIDEFGGTAGLVTMEDVLEELVGELRDEFDRGTPQIRASGDGSYVIDGLTALETLRERLGLELREEPYDTVGGLVFGRLGRLPKLGDGVDVESLRFEVTAMDGRRVAQVRARPRPADVRRA